jgi:hypothetical protein
MTAVLSFLHAEHSLWGHTVGAASNLADPKFLNEAIGRFLAKLN